MSFNKGINTMKTITVRGINSVLSERMKQAAKQEGKSVNQVVIDTMRQHFGMIKEKKFTVVYHDLDHIFGRWSQEEFDKIQGKIDTERKIDKELWL